MEREHQHEEDPQFAFECNQCGRINVIGDNNTILFLADDVDEYDEVVEKLFAYITCESGQCDSVTEEITPEMQQYVAHLSSYYDKEGERVTKLEEVIVVREWYDYMEDFLRDYQPEAWEFDDRTRNGR